MTDSDPSESLGSNSRLPSRGRSSRSQTRDSSRHSHSQTRSSSRRSAGSSHTRSRSSRSRNSSSRSLPHSSILSRAYRGKEHERNLVTAIFSILVIVALSVALAEPRWIHLYGGGCNVNILGADQFFYMGTFTSERITTSENHENNRIFVPSDKYSQGDGFGYKPKIVYHYSGAKVLENCVSRTAVMLMKAIIGITFIAIISSFIAFLLDLLGPTERILRAARRNAIFSIITVILCVVINGFCYWFTVEVDSLQKSTKRNHGSKVEVTFDISFYMVTAAGGLAVIATACNCLRRYPLYEDSQSDALLDDYDDGVDNLYPEPEIATLSGIPPPPAYTP